MSFIWLGEKKSMPLDEFYLLYMHITDMISVYINMHIYTQFSFLMKKLKIKKKQIQFLEHREVIRPYTKNINLSAFIRYHLSYKNLEKTLKPTRDVIL